MIAHESVKYLFLNNYFAPKEGGASTDKPMTRREQNGGIS